MITLRRANNYIEKQLAKKRRGRLIFVSVLSTSVIITVSAGVAIAIATSDAFKTGGGGDDDGGIDDGVIITTKSILESIFNLVYNFISFYLF